MRLPAAAAPRDQAGAAPVPVLDATGATRVDGSLRRPRRRADRSRAAPSSSCCASCNMTVFPGPVGVRGRVSPVPFRCHVTRSSPARMRMPDGTDARLGVSTALIHELRCERRRSWITRRVRRRGSLPGGEPAGRPVRQSGASWVGRNDAQPDGPIDRRTQPDGLVRWRPATAATSPRPGRTSGSGSGGDVRVAAPRPRAAGAEHALVLEAPVLGVERAVEDRRHVGASTAVGPGRTSTNAEPARWTDATSRSPPIARASSRAIGKPRPVPLIRSWPAIR